MIDKFIQIFLPWDVIMITLAIFTILFIKVFLHHYAHTFINDLPDARLRVPFAFIIVF